MTDPAEPEALPFHFGIVLFPGFQLLDASGPLDALNSLSRDYPTNLSIIAATMDPVSTNAPAGGNISSPQAGNFSQSIVPTHTFETAPKLEVLIVPGGLGTRHPSIQGAVDFVARVYPSLKYLITVCTGSIIAARGGVLDGRRATTNKAAWVQMTAQRAEVKWVAHARWVVDGNIWTSSGVSAGLDVIFAWIAEVYGEEYATNLANFLEYERHTDSTWDPYADLYGLKDPQV